MLEVQAGLILVCSQALLSANDLSTFPLLLYVALFAPSGTLRHLGLGQGAHISENH